MTPQSRSSTLIGTPTDDRRHPPWAAASPIAPDMSAKSTRAVWPVSNTSVVALCPPSGNWLPTGIVAAAPVLVHAPTTVTESRGSYRIESATSTPSSRPASAATAAKTFSGGAAWATSIATLRKAACSPAICRNPA
jgi:hypothetical protein